MGKRKKKKTKNITQSWDEHYFGYHVPYYYFDTANAKEIHKIAEEIFGKTGYIEHQTLTNK